MTFDCARTRELLDDRLDGVLPSSERQAVDRHLESCSSCRAQESALAELRHETARLPREIEPPRDLWPAIASRLATTPRASLLDFWRRPAALLGARGLAVAAALIALVGVMLWTALPSPPTAPVTTETEPAAAAPLSDEIYRARAEIARSEDGVLLAHQDLLEAVQRQRDRLPPETVRAIEENMHIIDQAIGQIRSALDENPLNQQLNRLLAAQYQHEAHLLRRVSRA